MVRIADLRGRRRPVSTQRPQDFVSQAFPSDRRNTRYVALASVRPVRQGWRTSTVTKIPGQRARRYQQLVYPPAGYSGSLRACRGLRIDCQCGRYLYVFNYVLNERDLAVTDRTNQQPPDETNPEPVHVGACKHMIVVLRYLGRENPYFPHDQSAAPPTSDPAAGGNRTGSFASTSGRSQTPSRGTVRLSTIRTARKG